MRLLNGTAVIGAPRPAAPGRRRERALRLASAAIGVAAGLLAGELALRAWSLATGRNPAQELQRTVQVLPPKPHPTGCAVGRQASLGQLVRPSREAGIVYELKPNIETCFYHSLVHTNSQGLRAPSDFARPKPKDVFRILLLGDSQTFGWGVDHEQTYGAVLERTLNARPKKKRRVEVVNTGVPGYNAAQEAEVLRLRGLSFEPDCVFVLFIGNDFGVPFLMLAPPDPLDPRRSYLLATVRAALRPARYERSRWIFADEELADRLTDASLERVPPEYRHMVGVDGYERALASMAETGRRAGVPIVDFADYKGIVPPATEARLGRAHERLGILRPTFRYPPRPWLWLSQHDHHLTAQGHRSLARRMLAGLHEIGRCLADGKGEP